MRTFWTTIFALHLTIAWGQAALEVYPPEFTLTGKRESLQLVVTRQEGERVSDRTREVAYEVEDPAIVSVSKEGVVRPLANGATVIRTGDRSVKVTVAGADLPDPVSFRHETLPVLSRLGCSAGSCHGSPHGKGNFRLSLRAFDPALDALTLVSEELGRRTNPIEPDQSLLLLKPTTQVSHEGGKRLEKDGTRRDGNRTRFLSSPRFWENKKL